MSTPELPTRHFGVSTDSGGVFGRPEQWQQVWGFLEEDSAFKGFEMIAWGGRLSLWTELLLKQARTLELNVIGLHGRTGGVHDSYSLPDRIVLGTLNRIILPTPKLITYRDQVEYILVHGPELKNNHNLELVEENLNAETTIFIENHIRPGSDGTAWSIANDLRVSGVNAGVMFDLFHYFRRFNGCLSLEDRWQKTLSRLQLHFRQLDENDQSIPIGIHIPVGSNRYDSLPVKAITHSMWRDLGTILNRNSPAQIIIENQQAGIAGAVPIKLLEQYERNCRIIEIVRRAQVI